jgi:hypothetical protein
MASPFHKLSATHGHKLNHHHSLCHGPPIHLFSAHSNTAKPINLGTQFRLLHPQSLSFVFNYNKHQSSKTINHQRTQAITQATLSSAMPLLSSVRASSVHAAGVPCLAKPITVEPLLYAAEPSCLTVLSLHYRFTTNPTPLPLLPSSSAPFQQTEAARHLSPGLQQEERTKR